MAVATWLSSQMWHAADSLSASKTIIVLAGILLTGCGGGGGDVGWAKTNLLPAAPGPIVPPPRVISVGIHANDIVAEPISGKIYVAANDDSPVARGTISAIDPSTGAIEKSVYPGAAPTTLAVSDDGAYLYAALSNFQGVQRYRLPDLTLDLNIPINMPDGVYQHDGLPEVLFLEVAPGHPRTIAISAGRDRYAKWAAIYDDSVRRPKIVGFADGVWPYTIKWAGDDARLFAVNSRAGDFALYSLSVDSDGITVDGIYPQLHAPRNPNYSAVESNVHFAGGLLYGDAGEVVNPFTATSVGYFNAKSRMAPDIAKGAAFFMGGGEDGSLRIIAKDIERFGTLSSVSLDGIDCGGAVMRLARWGDSGIALACYDAEIVLVESELIARPHDFAVPVYQPRALDQVPLQGMPQGTVGRVYSFGANQMVWDRWRDKIVASIAGWDPYDPNALAVVDLDSGEVVQSSYLGSEPNRLALSDDGEYLYVGVDATSNVLRLASDTLSPELRIDVPPGDFSRLRRAADLKVAPGMPKTFAINYVGFEDQSFNKLQIFDNDTPRTKTVGDSGGGDNEMNAVGPMQWSADATQIYLFPNDFSFNLTVLDVAADGIRTSTEYADVLERGCGGGSNIHYVNGVAFTDNGVAVRASDGARLAEFGKWTPACGPYGRESRILPDPSTSRVFYITCAETCTYPGATYFLEAYSLKTLKLLASIKIEGLDSTPLELVRWGRDGLAFTTGAYQTFAIKGRFVGE